MSPGMRLTFDTRPRGFKVAHGQTGIDVRLCREGTYSVVNTSVDAVVGNFIAWAERVGVIGEGAVGDAACGARTVASEAVDWVEDGGAAEFAGV